MTLSAIEPAEGEAELDAAGPARQQAFIRAELIRRLFAGSAQARYFSLVLWPVIAAIYWRQIDLLELTVPFLAHVAVTACFDVLRRRFARSPLSDEQVVRWGWWFAGLSFLAGACWGTAGFILAAKDFELQRMLLCLVLLAAITTAVPIRSAHPPTFYAFATATTAPLLLVLLTSADPFFQLVGIAGGAYVGHLMVYVRDVHRWQYDNIALAAQKEELARRLQVAYDEARRARDAALAAQREAENANQAKSTFLATVSHEIRTPMNGVLGMIDVLNRSPLSVDQRESLATVHNSAASLLRIIDDILDFSKIEAGHLDIESLELSTIELVEGVAETLSPQAAAKGVRLVAYVAPDVPEHVSGDPLRLRQILFNLVGNAIKFTEQGSVRLTLERSPDRGEGEIRLLIRVADTGIGLTAEQRERLFQPFVQADNSTTRRFGGTGLGLSIVRRLADAMQGDIAVESQPGRGSVFSVSVMLAAAGPGFGCRTQTLLKNVELILTLPDPEEARAIGRYLRDAGADVRLAASQGSFFGIEIAGASGASRRIALGDMPASGDGVVAGLPRPWRRDALIRAVARAAAPSAAATVCEIRRPEESRELRGRVLVVDDNSVNRKVLARQLALSGVSIDAAASGEEALELWRHGTYDLVLADLQMPTMDGFELTRRIRSTEAAERRPRTPILAVTASTLEEQEHESRAAGMDGFITKPIGIDRLGVILDAWLMGRLPRAAAE